MLSQMSNETSRRKLRDLCLRISEPFVNYRGGGGGGGYEYHEMVKKTSPLGYQTLRHAHGAHSDTKYFSINPPTPSEFFNY